MSKYDQAYITEQEAFWAGDFGNEYTHRQDDKFWIAANKELFQRILKSATDVHSIMELGCNAGLNLIALSQINSDFCLNGIEINSVSAIAAQNSVKGTISTGSILNPIATEKTYDFVFTKGVLIHISPNYLHQVYENLNRLSRRYVLVAEYYNPSPTEIPYRGHEERLFKRDFAGELIERYGFLLVDYGFAYHRDPMCPQDDLTWFLLKKDC